MLEQVRNSIRYCSYDIAFLENGISMYFYHENFWTKIQFFFFICHLTVSIVCDEFYWKRRLTSTNKAYSNFSLQNTVRY